ncbi:MAG: T9SS type A sorting domain-containing protein [Flavobacteriaceae bacterium]|nr:T9SS type A sorting domain-containing protein [Flavobacteriaceae bacterium]
MFRLIFYFSFIGISQFSFAQLSGNYTIGGTSGAGNYPSWSDFASAVANNGVSGNVSVKAMSNLSISALIQFSQNSSNPTSSSKKITIDGNGKTLTGSLSYELIWFDGIDFLEIKNLTLINSSASSGVMGIRFSNGANDNSISDCTIEFSGLKSTGAAYIAFASNQSSINTVSTSNNGIRNTIQNTVMLTSYKNSPGPVYGILNTQGSATYKNTATDNTFSKNTIKNFYSYGLYSMYTNGDQYTNNDVSRSVVGSGASCDSIMMGMYCNYSYGTDRSSIFSGNVIHDLPYALAASSSNTNFISKFYGCVALNNTGTSKMPFILDGNTVSKIAAYNSLSAFDLQLNEVVNFSKNKMLQLNVENSSDAYGLNAYKNVDFDVTGNLFRSCIFGQGGMGFLISTTTNSSRSWNICEDNVLDSNTATSGKGFRLIFITNGGNCKINRNTILFNESLSSNSYLIGIHLESLGDVECNSNLIIKNLGEAVSYGLYNINYYSGFKAEYRQNTIYARGSSNSGHTGFGYYMEDESTLTFTGNILDIKGPAFGFPVCLFSSIKIKELNNNSYYARFSGGEQWGIEQNGYSSYADYKASGIPGTGDNFLIPRFKDIAKNDFRSQSFKTQNNVPSVSSVSSDVLKQKRHPVKSDRGAVENSLDLSVVRTNYSLASQICSGFTSKVSLTIKNNFIDTVQNFDVAFTVNGVKTKQTVTTKIFPGDTAIIFFNKPIVLSKTGNTVVKIFIDIPDDNNTNDTLIFKTFVKPAPGGSVFSISTKTSTGNNPYYQKGKNLDITVINVPVIYDINSPRAYTNSEYGTSSPGKWYASAQGYLSSGKTVSGATITAPSGKTNLEVQFKTADDNYEDSVITLVLKISDMGNGCDTLIYQRVLIYPSVTTDFSYPSKICVGDTIQFINKSKSKSPYVETFWDFGTGNSADTSIQIDANFVYLKPGIFKVKLRNTINLYGFVFPKTNNITVSEIPKVGFTRQNVCFGSDVLLTNKTTPSNAKMYWNFGDGNGFNLNNSNTISVKYPKEGTYLIVLKADVLGCDATLMQKTIVFEKPKAAFIKLSGRCDNVAFEFQNNSTISVGGVGSNWYFDNRDSTSNDVNPSYIFRKAGTKTVTLVVRSEFGCKDSVINKYTVFESPKVEFSHSSPCIRKATVFVNVTPDVKGGIPTYTWDFGDGDSASSKSPSHNWTTTGKKTVLLKVKLDNGCFSETQRDLNVLLQPTAAFSVGNPCSGELAAFKNESVPEGINLTYRWDFSDNSQSTVANPQKSYMVKKTTNFNVTLYAYLKDGCSDSITKSVSVMELPKTCNFTAIPDYQFAFYGLRLAPLDENSILGGQAGINYTWTVFGLGIKNSKDLNAEVNYDLQIDGLYTVSMKAVSVISNCECSVSKQFIMDRASVNATINSDVRVFPNPVNGILHIVLNPNLQNASAKIYDALGKELGLLPSFTSFQKTDLLGISSEKLSQSAADGLIEFNLLDISAGIYWVKIQSSGREILSRIVVQ